MTDERTPSEKLEAQGFVRGADFETVGDILERTDGTTTEGSDRGLTAASPPFALARLESYRTPPIQPGIYFGMPDEIYHAIPAFSSHGIKDLAESSMVYWERCRWLNPDWEEQEEKDHLTLGKAYECRILEGKEAFDARFASAPDRRDYPNALVTGDDIKEKLRELGITPRGASKTGWMAQLREFDPDAQLWDEIKNAYFEENEGKLFISAASARSVEIANRIVQLSEDQAAVVNQGHAQVSLFWTCKKTGVPMKCRVDKLLVRAIIDMKTIGNISGSFEVWIPRTIANYRYNLQPSVYFEGVDAVRQLVREHGASVIRSYDHIQEIIGPGEIDAAAQEVEHAERVAWAMKWASNRAPDEWLWLFVRTSPPITRLVHYPRGGTTKMVTDDIVSRMKRRFREMNETFGTDPWLDLAPRIDLADEDIPRWSTEI